ncbi:HTH DNA binding domain-containing protein [Halopelagius inordinatus]|uniref:HTH DNA binding domain-containing protein n=1 Tax=Halopelagius inordinatus TaxID=553467 RepID=A0A1I2T3A5_9EURY|nr:helix-turn-helix domain-containing protein [Halopelagius inordinatus]SFG58609.1 HTH DNA binding domain-containing protein [Halopelagius inordinatus]
MADVDSHSGQSRLTLEIWHPDCWTLEVTDETPAGLLAHTVFNTSGEQVKGHFTAYGDTTADVDELVAAAERSALTSAVSEMQRRHDFRGRTPGNTSRELFVEYDPENSVSDALVSNDFIQAAPVRVFDGREYWSLFVDDDREGVRKRLDAVRDETNADITVTKITRPDAGVGDAAWRADELSARQREVFELARKRDYYDWPRGISARDLADELDISKTTLLEHLRKAESKLLNPDSSTLS